MVIVFSVMVIHNIFQTGTRPPCVQEYGKISRNRGYAQTDEKNRVPGVGMLLALAAVPRRRRRIFRIVPVFDWLVEESMTATMRGGTGYFSSYADYRGAGSRGFRSSVWLSLEETG